jgi:hypothetical protein
MGNGINANKRKLLARQAARLAPSELRRMTDVDERRTLLACFVIELLYQVTDQIIDMHHLILRYAISRALGREKADLFRKRKDIHLILNAFDDMVDVLLDLGISDVRAEVFKDYPPELLAMLRERAKKAAKPPGYDPLMGIRGFYSTLRSFGSDFLKAFTFHATTPLGETVLSAITFLQALDTGKRKAFVDAPTGFVPDRLRKVILDSSGKATDQHLWELALHQRLGELLRSGDIWVEHSLEYGSLEDDLRVTDEAREDFLKRHPHLKTPKAMLDKLKRMYLKSATKLNRIWPDLEAADAVWLEGNEVHLARLKAEEEPSGTEQIRRAIEALLPRRKFTEVFREVLHWLDFLKPFKAGLCPSG